MNVYSAGQVRQPDSTAPSGLLEVLTWVNEYLASSHPHLGRSGAVCPYVKPALRAGTLYLAEVRLGVVSVAAVDACVAAYGRAFANLSGGHAKALVVSFPMVAVADAPELLGGLLDRLKPQFVSEGLMLGPVYPGNPLPGAHNPAFHAMSGPLPLVAIRHLMESDLPFLSRSSDPPERRADYIDAYLRHLGPRLSERRRHTAERALGALSKLSR